MDEDSNEFLVNAVEVESHPEVDEVYGSINFSSSENREEEKLRQKLKFFYMNPLEKWHHKQRVPYKLFIQIIKIFVITYQSYHFAHHHNVFVGYVFNNKIAFSHLFLEGWDPSREIISYPPQSGDLAVYKSSDFFSAIDFAVVNYVNLDEAVGTYSYAIENNTVVPMEFCFYHYKVCDIFGFNESYVFDSEVLKTCTDINITEIDAKNFSSKEYFEQKNLTIQFSALIKAELSFRLRTVNLRPSLATNLPNCFQFNLSIIFDNEAHSGKIKITLDTIVHKLTCRKTAQYDNQFQSIKQGILNSFVIVLCLISFLLCSRALYRAWQLKKRTAEFFKKQYNKDLSSRSQLGFINVWYVTMIISDCITIIGSSLKQKIERSEFSGDEWNLCSVLLGTGTLLIWCCILRYLGFFKIYNVIVLTIKVAAPMISRFMVCAIIIYTGFIFCGWMVLGPYHSKFRTLSVTSECLFALINGDDVFGTFSTLEPTKSVLIWWFSRVYLFFFISLFIYVVLSLLVSVILDAYERIKHFYTEGFPKTEIQEFIDGGLSHTLFSDSSSSLADDFQQCFSGEGKFAEIMRKVCCCGVFKKTRNNSHSDR